MKDVIIKKDIIIKTVIPTVVALITAIGGCSIQLHYERGKSTTANQEIMKSFVVSFAKACNK